MTNTSRTIPSLDGARALSIAAVLAWHAYESLPEPVRALSFMHFLANQGLGVNVFFAISGFLITHLLLKEDAACRSIDLRRFYFRRTLRIFPPFYAFLAVMAILALTGIRPQAPEELLSAATYTWNYTANQTPGWDLAHSWSLSLEEQFYLLWPACLVFLGPRRAQRFAVAALVLSPISRLLTYALVPAWRGHIGMMLHTRVDCILFGCVLALCWKSTSFQSKLKQLHRAWILWAMLLFLCIGSPLLRGRFHGSYDLPLGLTLESACITVLLAWAIQNPAARVGRFLNHPVAVHFGVRSYSLYIWQQIFCSPGSVFPVNIVLAVLAAEVSYVLVEKPSLRLRDWLEARWLSGAAAPIASSAQVAD